jgi:carboxypeptidase C (cathepsin A)
MGQFKEVDMLTFLRVYNAGHMVPMDQPEAALDMLDRFFGNWHRERMAKVEPEPEQEESSWIE